MATEFVVSRNVDVPMRDGVLLRANIFRPAVSERLPVLLQRTPYGKDFSDVGFALLAASRGYAVVVQDTRGRWDSEGQHYPFRDEFEDGYDSVEWAAGQPWANGKVGMWGGSYVGWTQWAAAATQPPSLVTICPTVTFTDVYGDLFHPSGALALGVAVSWCLGSVASMEVLRAQVSEKEKAALTERWADALDGLSSGSTFRTLPTTAIPLLDGWGATQAFQDLVNHPEADALWDAMNVRGRIGRMAVPALHLGGWYDIFAHATARDYALMRERAATEMARSGQKLIMGPWLHGPLSGVVGDVDFGVRASDAFVLSNEILLRWFDYWLKGVQNGILEEPPVRIFVMGLNAWRNEQEWPLARTRYTPWYLHSVGRANSVRGDGTLSPQQPGAELADGYTYDPRQPVPTRGGGLCCSAAALRAGAFDQRQIEERPDVLVYTSEPLQESVEVTGPVRVVLWAASDAVDTDFTAKLVDVYPCGRARNVVDGIVRACHRQGWREAVLLDPGQVVQYTIDLGPTSNVFLQGHRIRLEISSSNYPKFERHPNTAGPVRSQAEMVVAHQTIYHDVDHPSHVLLPIIPA